MARIDTDNRLAHLVQLGPKPCRHGAALLTDADDILRMGADEGCDPLRVRWHHCFLQNRSRLVDDADCGLLQ